MDTKQERELKFATSRRLGALIDKRTNGEIDQELFDGIVEMKEKNVGLESMFVAEGIILSGMTRGIEYTEEEVNELLEMYGLDRASE